MVAKTALLVTLIPIQEVPAIGTWLCRVFEVVSHILQLLAADASPRYVLVFILHESNRGLLISGNQLPVGVLTNVSKSNFHDLQRQPRSPGEAHSSRS